MAPETCEGLVVENGVENVSQDNHSDNDNVSCPDPNLRPEIVAGEDITATRPIFDNEDKNIIVTARRHILYYCTETCTSSGKAAISREKLEPNERIISSDKFDQNVYVFTNRGQYYIWNMETRDWTNQLCLPIGEEEALVTCRMFSKRQYIYSVHDKKNDKIQLFISMSRSERERPRHKELIGDLETGGQTEFDIGCIHDQVELSQNSKTARDKLSKQHCLVYVNGSHIYFHRLTVGEKWSPGTSKQRIDSNTFTCVRANQRRTLVAAGDSLGRVYLYSGDCISANLNRTKLHWHTLPVNDLSFSSTGNTLFSVGGESGCVVIWDISPSNIGQKKVIARLGMPIRYLSCGNTMNTLALSFEDNELKFLDTTYNAKTLKTMTRRAIDIYQQNNARALRSNFVNSSTNKSSSIGLLWHSKTDSIVMNSKPGHLQFYSLKEKAKLYELNFLRTNILSLEKDAKVQPSEISIATLTTDGEWMAFYETQESSISFPDIKLHIWQRSPITGRWSWIQTANRIHSSPAIADLKFSPDGQYLISACEDGSFQVLYRVCMDARDIGKASKKQMYAKGYVGKVPEKLPGLVTVSRDSSVMAMSLKNNTTLIWMIADAFKLVYECQLNQLSVDAETPSPSETNDKVEKASTVLGLQFGYHKPSESVAPLCEIRSNSIRIWNILNPDEAMVYPDTKLAANTDSDNSDFDEYTAAAFDNQKLLDHFAVSTRKNMILLFKLEIPQSTGCLTPLIIIDANPTLNELNSKTFYTSMCFQGSPILELDEQSHQNTEIIKILNRLCLMNNHQELVGITDRLTLERQAAENSCNVIRTVESHELETYITRGIARYAEETSEASKLNKFDLTIVTEKQRKIRNRQEVQKMLKDLLIRIPSQNLPRMEILGPMILDKLT